MKQPNQITTKDEAVEEIIETARMVWAGPSAEQRLYDLLRRYDEICVSPVFDNKR